MLSSGQEPTREVAHCKRGPKRVTAAMALVTLAAALAGCSPEEAQVPAAVLKPVRPDAGIPFGAPTFTGDAGRERDDAAVVGPSPLVGSWRAESAGGGCSYTHTFDALLDTV